MHGDRLVAVGYSKLGPRDRLEPGFRSSPWPHPIRNCLDRSHCRSGRARPSRTVRARAIGRSAGQKVLEQLVELYDQAMREPLPLATEASAAYAIARRNQGDVDEAVRMARRPWVSGDFPGEDADAANELVWGRRADFDVLLAERRCWTHVPRRADPVRRHRRPVVGPVVGGRANRNLPRRRSTSATRCRPAPRYWRPARGPARPTPSPPWSPATWQKVTRPSSGCSWSPLAGRPVRNCGSGSRDQLVKVERGLADPRAARGSDEELLQLLAEAHPTPRWPPGADGSPPHWPTSTRPPLPPPTSSASRC